MKALGIVFLAILLISICIDLAHVQRYSDRDASEHRLRLDKPARPLPSRSGPGDAQPEMGTRHSPPASPMGFCPAGELEGAIEYEANSVYYHSGEFYHRTIDLLIPGRGLDFVWARKYRSRLGREAPQGHCWDFSYNISIIDDGPDIILYDGNSREDRYLYQGDSSWTASEFFREIKQNPDGSYTLTFSDTGTWQFHAISGDSVSGKIERIEDRNGNAISFQYDTLGRLEKVIDTLNREIDIAYNMDGFIESITDFAGREVHYEYYQFGETGGSEGDLKSARTPVVENTAIFPVPPGHEFPAGKTTTYTYSENFVDDRLNHNLLSITDPKGQMYLTNTYASTENPFDFDFDRITTQIWGDPGDSISFVYVALVPDAGNDSTSVMAIVNDRAGNVSEYFYNDRAQCRIKREYTGRADPDAPTTETLNRPTGKLRPGDPDYFETRYEYNEDSMPTRIIYPELNETRNIYELDLDPGAASRSRGNLRELHRIPGPRGGDQDSIIEYFEYDTGLWGGCCGMNFVTLHVNGRGDSTVHTYDDHGNRTHIQYPVPSSEEDWEYNEYGQITRHIRPDNGSGSRREDVYTYYDSGEQEGYLYQRIVDEAGYALTTTYEYDAVGNLIREIDPRGHDTRYIVNQLNQVVQESSPEVTDGSGIRYTTETYYDENDNIVRIDVENIDEQGATRPNALITTTYDYEALNRVVRKTAEANSTSNVVTEYEYDANRNRRLIHYGEATGGDQDPGTPGVQPSNTLSMEYDERDLLYHEIRAGGDPLQSTTQYDYDGNGNMSRLLGGMEETPRESLWQYDGYDRISTITDPMGNEITYEYDENGNTLSIRVEGELADVTGNAGNVRLSEATYTYDEMNRRILEEVEFFDTETQAPILDGQSTTQTDYSDNSQIVRVTDDNSNALEIIYDTANRMQTTTDAKGNRTVRTYDENSNVNRVREVERSDLGGPDEQFVASYEYDNLDRLTATTDNANQATQYEYDSRDNMTVETDARGNTIEYEYDGLNRLIKTASIMTDNGLGSGTPVDTIMTFQEWDDSGRRIDLTDDNGNATQYTYDPLDRMVATYFADGTIDSAGYDVHDNETYRIDASGSEIFSLYDLLDRLTGRTIITAPGVMGTTYENYIYDGLSRIVSAEDDDSSVNRKYNSLSHVTSETLDFFAVSSSGGGEDTPARPVERPKAAGSAKRTRLEKADNTLRSAGKPRGRRADKPDKSEIFRVRPLHSPGTTTCSYDGVGNLLSCAYPGGRQVTRTYDELNRVKTIADLSGTIAAYAYIGRWRVERLEYPKPLPRHTIRTSYSYDWLKRVTGTTSVRDPQNEAEVVDARTYTWDAVSNKTGRADIRAGSPRLSHRYHYDSASRLVNTKVSDGFGATVRETEYTLDGVGNREVVVGDNCPGTYWMDPTLPEPADFQVNQYTFTPCSEREYDRNGNLTQTVPAPMELETYSYDYTNRMVRHEDVSLGIVTEYYHDPFGRLIAKEVSGNPRTRYFYHGSQIIEEQEDYTGTTQATYVHGLFIDEVLNMRRDGEDYYYHADDLYNVVAVTNDSGSIVERYEYRDYGEPEFFNGAGSPIDSSAVGNPYLFSGRRYDAETEFYYYRTRYLDPVAGRFTSRDKLDVRGSRSVSRIQKAYAASYPWYRNNSLDSRIGAYGSRDCPAGICGANLYAYVDNNPFTRIDPTGMIYWKQTWELCDNVFEDCMKKAWDERKPGDCLDNARKDRRKCLGYADDDYWSGAGWAAAGTALATIGGYAAAGAAAGSFAPGPGTVAGAVAGAAIGVGVSVANLEESKKEDIERCNKQFNEDVARCSVTKQCADKEKNCWAMYSLPFHLKQTGAPFLMDVLVNREWYRNWLKGHTGLEVPSYIY